MILLLIIINKCILYYFIVSAAVNVLVLFGSLPMIVRYFNRQDDYDFFNALHSSEMPPVTVIIPMYNEQERIIQAVKSALHANYPNVYIFVVNDGSTDHSLALLKKTFTLEEVPLLIEEIFHTAPIKSTYVSADFPQLMVIDKENYGSADAVNAGLNACFTPYFMMFDADSIMDTDAISELMFEMLSWPNAIGIGGAVYISNNCQIEEGEVINSAVPTSYTASMQVNEYLRSHLFNRTGWNIFGGTMCYSGSASLYSTQAIREIGGYDRDNCSYDVEIVTHLHRHMLETKKTYAIGFTPSATIWTHVPNTLLSYARQRDHWRRGMLRSTLKHFRMFFNPRYKLVGLVSFPVYFLIEVMAPFVEFTAYISVALAFGLGILSYTSLFLYILLAWGFSAFLNIANASLSLITFNRYQTLADIPRMFFLACGEMFGFRQYMTVVNTCAGLHYAWNRLRKKPY